MSKEDDLLEKAVQEEYEKEQYIFYSSEEFRDMAEQEPPPEILYRLSGMSWKYRWKRRLRRLGQNIASLLVLLIGSFILMGALDRDVRATCIQWIKNAVSGGMTNYQAASSEKTSSPNKENEPTAGFTLGYIPDGYVLKNADMGKETGKATYCKETKQLKFSYIYANGIDTLINNENSDLFHVELNDGTVCDLYKNTSEGYGTKLIWQKENFTCTLYVSDIDEKELIKIAEGVKIINT